MEQPLSQLRIEPWPDPVIDRLGFPPHSPYLQTGREVRFVWVVFACSSRWNGVFGPQASRLFRTRLGVRSSFPARPLGFPPLGGGRVFGDAVKNRRVDGQAVGRTRDSECHKARGGKRRLRVGTSPDRASAVMGQAQPAPCPGKAPYAS